MKSNQVGDHLSEGIQVELNSHDPHDHNFSHDPKNLHDQINISVYLKISPPFNPTRAIFFDTILETYINEEPMPKIRTLALKFWMWWPPK